MEIQIIFFNLETLNSTPTNRYYCVLFRSVELRFVNKEDVLSNSIKFLFSKVEIFF